MRIVLTIGHNLDPRAGSPGATLAVADAYRRAGHSTEVMSLDDLPAGLSATAAMLAFPLLVAKRLTGSLGRWCDVVDSAGGDAWLWSLRRPARSGGPLLVTWSHGLEHREHLEWLRDHKEGRIELRHRYFLYHGGERLREVALALRRADLAFLLNHDDLAFAVAELGVDRGRAHLTREGLPETFVGLPAPRPSVHPDDLRIALVARHTPGMGCAYSVPALERILLRHPRVRVTLLGSIAPASDVLLDFCAEVRDRIDVVPTYERSDLPKLLAGHEILVSAKFCEGFGMALIEGMACGLAAVVAAASGPKRLVEHGRTGLLVPPRDVGGLVDAIERLIADDGLRLRLRQRAHASVQCYSWDAVAVERLALIESAVALRGEAKGLRHEAPAVAASPTSSGAPDAEGTPSRGARAA